MTGYACGAVYEFFLSKNAHFLLQSRFYVDSNIFMSQFYLASPQVGNTAAPKPTNIHVQAHLRANIYGIGDRLIALNLTVPTINSSSFSQVGANAHTTNTSIMQTLGQQIHGLVLKQTLGLISTQALNPNNEQQQISHHLTMLQILEGVQNKQNIDPSNWHLNKVTNLDITNNGTASAPQFSIEATFVKKALNAQGRTVLHQKPLTFHVDMYLLDQGQQPPAPTESRTQGWTVVDHPDNDWVNVELKV